MRYFLFFFILLISLQQTNSQTYPKDYFRAPLDIPLFLSGTFGELRSNHFHSGIDIKTQGVINHKVYAVADGYVSRIKVSGGGYGKTLYITHPAGYVSVYGHLNKYNDSLQKFVKELQYEKKRFSVEVFPEKESFKVKKGDVIAYSGNTGGSQGPHLHFEIREEASQHPINPLLFESIKVKDFTRPKILGLAIYPVDENSTINGKKDSVFYVVEGWGESHRIKGNPSITVSGNIGFGIKTHDRMNEINNKNGVYKVSLELDSLQVFGLKMNKLSFSTTRYLNSLIDYHHYKKIGSRFIRTTIDTNNRLFIYNNVINNGIYNFSDTLMHKLEYFVSDAYDNFSTLKFNIKSSDSKDSIEQFDTIQGRPFVFSRSNYIDENGIKVSFPANTFYQSLNFVFETQENETENLSKVYQLHNKYVPLQKYITVSILPDSIDKSLISKLYVAYSPAGKSYWYAGAKANGKYISAKTRLLGYFKLEVDTIAPQIKALNISDGKNISAQKSIKVSIKDKQSSIVSFKAYLNEKWILMEYDPKNNLLVYNYDDRLVKGENQFKLIVIDALKNESEYKAKLIY